MGHLLRIAFLCLSATLASTAPAQFPATAPAETQAAVAAGGATVGASAPASNDDFAPPLLLGAVLAIVLLCAVVLILAALAGVAALILGAVLLLFGIISSSVLVGLLRRTRGSAVRAFVVQASAVAGVPVGILALWLENRLFHFGFSYRVMVSIGAAGGLVIGAGMGCLLNLATTQIARFLTRRLQRHPRSAPLGGFPAVVHEAAANVEAD